MRLAPTWWSRLFFVSFRGPFRRLNTSISYLGGRGLRIYDEVCWSDCVRQLPYVMREDRDRALLWFCETYGVGLIELWFDPEPNSQLQLIWILDYLRSKPSVMESLRLRGVDFELRGADPAELRRRDVQECGIAASDLEIASMAWEAYRAPTPELCFGLLDRPLGKLSFLKLKHDPEKCAAVFRKDHAQTIT